MSTTSKGLTRREFLAMAGGGAVGLAAGSALGIYAFPRGRETVEEVAPGLRRLTRAYPARRVARLPDLVEGQPVDFTYPGKDHPNFAVKLGRPAWDGVGPDGDIVAFSYLCPHMGCPLKGQYQHQYAALGPCPCHFSTYDLAKSGSLIRGQATQSLPQILLELRGEEIYALGVLGLIYGYRDNLREESTA